MQKTGFLKRFLALVLCFLMVFSTIPTAALAAETNTDQTTVEEQVDAPAPDEGQGDPEDTPAEPEPPADPDEDDEQEEDPSETPSEEAPSEEAAAAPTPVEVTTDPAEPAVVTVTVAIRGGFAKTKDGEAMVEQPVTVTDLNGDGMLSYAEALAAAHGEYFDGETATLWGEDGEALYFCNNIPVSGDVAGAMVAEEDTLYAAIATESNDYYTYFDTTGKEVQVGEAFTLTLLGGGDVFAVTEAAVGIWVDGEFVSLDKTTDETGSVTLSFEQPGIYVVTARGTVTLPIPDSEETTTASILAPYCVVAVGGQADTLEGEDVMPVADYGKVFVTSNVEDVIWTSNGSYDVTGITDKPVIWMRSISTDGEVTNKYAPTIKILNYTQLSESYTLDYISFDGHQISLADFTTTLTAIDTSGWTDSALKGKDIRISLVGNCPHVYISKNQINALASDANIVIQFNAVKSDKANLTVNAGEHGSFVEAKYISENEDGSHTYTVYGKPAANYQLSSYTVKGPETQVMLNLTGDNYRWVENDNFFNITISKDTEITLDFTPATMELELWSYQPKNTTDNSWNVDMFGRIFDTDGTDKWNRAFEENKQSVPLLDDLGAKFYFKLNIKGFKDYGTEGENCQLKLYSGDTADESKLLFDSTAKEYIVNTTPSIGNGLRGDRSVGAQVLVGSIPNDLSSIHIVFDWAGYQFTGTYSVQMASEIAEVKEFTNYYTTNYGLDKQGKAAYTTEEKLTSEYQTYCRYSNFRYVLRQAYNEYLTKISSEGDEATRQSLLAQGKQALDDAAKGKDCNAVVWSFMDKDGMSSIPVMVAIPNKSSISANEAMIAALEALVPGNWTYTYKSTQFGAFVDTITAGGESDIGSIIIDSSGGNVGNGYGFWFYNGKFSDWGVSNYYPYDGDVMWWGSGNVERNWDWAKLRLYYGSDEALNSALAARGISKSISTMSAAEIEAAFSDLSDGSGKDFFRRNGQFRDVADWELVVTKIGAIGSVNSESGDKIKAARDAYDALSDADKAKVTNYSALTAAEAAYKALTEKATVTYSDALDSTLTKLGTQDLSVGSTNGEWAVLALARGGKTVSDTYYNAALAYIQKNFNSNNRLDANKSSDNSRLILALTAIGKDATNISGKNLVAGLSDMSYISNQGVNGTAYALLALNSHVYTPTGVTKEDLVQSLLKAQIPGGGWALSGTETDVDVTAMVLQALAPYYENRTDVKTAVNTALEALKPLQKSTGGFSAYGDVYNAETIAQMVVALSALKIDPTTWNDKDAVDALLHFYNGDGTFKHDLNGDTNQMATEQSAYALVAYDRFKNSKNRLYDMTDVTFEGTTVPTEKACIALDVGGSYNNLFNQGQDLDLTGIVITAYWNMGDPTAVELKDVAISGYEKDTAGPQIITLTYEGVSTTIKVTVSDERFYVSVEIWGDTDHGTDEGPHGMATGFEKLTQWVNETNVEAAKGENVYDVLQRIFTKHEMTVQSDYKAEYASAYIKSINGIGEFTNGSLSGWLFSVNGEYPNKGVSAVDVKNGDKIVLHYTDDYTYEAGGDNYSGTYGDAEAKAVDALIEKIGTVELTDECEQTIADARKAYDALFASAKAKVTKLSVLEAAELELANLKSDAADKEKAKAVIDAIDALGTITLSSEANIQAARKAYDDLTDVQKALVTNVKTLETAEKILAALKAKNDPQTVYTTTGNYIAVLSAPTVGAIGGEWSVIGLARSGKTVPESYYASVLAYVEEHIDSNNRLDANKSTDNSRIILALTAIGKDVTNVGGHNLLAGLNDMDYIQKQGINGPIWALIALDSHSYEPTGNVTREKLKTVLLNAQLEDGGWALSGTKSDVDVTAMAVQALAPYVSESKVKTALDKAVAALSEKQDELGGYSTLSGSDTVATSESISQVIVALTAMGINPHTDSRFVKNSMSAVDALTTYFVKDGGFKHTSDGTRDGMATEQGYYAMTAYYRLVNKQNSLYNMSDVTIAGTTEPTTPTCYKLVASGNFKTQYTVGEELDLTGIVLTAKWTEGKADTTLSLSDVVPSGYDKTKAGPQVITLTYTAEKISTTINITVVSASSSKITVSVTILGDSAHGEASEPHGLALGGLSTWASESKFEAVAGESVWSVLQRVFTKYSMSVSADGNNSYGSIYIRSINGVGEFTNGSYSGWMYTLNGTHPNVGVSAKTVKQGDTIVLHYTDDYNFEEGGIYYGLSAGEAAAKKVDALIAAIGTVSYTDACKSKIDAARKAYDALSTANKQKVTKLSILTAAESKYQELKQADDKSKAASVVTLINQIGTVSKNSGTAINNAWSAYNALTADQKKMVTNLSTLNSATNTWNQLIADEVIELIKKIDTTITESSEKGIKEARTAYDKLTAAQKKLVTNYETLTNAETALAKLTATDDDKKKAQEVIDMIDKLGTITADSEKDVEAARKAYDSLTDIQKKLVTNYKTLETAEKQLTLLTAMVKVTDPYTATGDYLQKLGTPSVGTIGGEWMVIGLLRSDRNVPNLSDYYDSVVKYVEENIDENERLHSAKSTDNSRIILALTAMGKDVTNVGNHNLLAGLNDMDYIKKQGNNGPIWALIALDSGNYPVPDGNVTRKALINEILDAQTSDGGWALSGDEADADMTGMALTALAPYYTKDLSVQEAIDEALTRLSEMQNGDGGFATFSGNGDEKVATSESTAQIVVALTALGINPDTDARFIKNGNSAVDALLSYFVNGGGFKHIASGNLDGMATEQAYYALTAYYRFLQEKTSLYDMSDIIDMGGDLEEEVEETTEPTVPATTEPAEVEEETSSFPWAALVIMVVVALGGGAVAVIFLTKKKHGNFV